MFAKTVSQRQASFVLFFYYKRTSENRPATLIYVKLFNSDLNYNMKFCLEPDFFIIQVLLLRCQENILSLRLQVILVH